MLRISSLAGAKITTNYCVKFVQRHQNNKSTYVNSYTLYSFISIWLFADQGNVRAASYSFLHNPLPAIS